MFSDMILSIAAKQADISKVETKAVKSTKSRSSKSGRLESNADAFLAKHGFDVNGEVAK